MAGKRKAAPSALQPRLKALRTEAGPGSGSSLVATWLQNFNLSDMRSPRLWSPKTSGEKPHILTLPAEIRNQIFLDAIQQTEPIIPQATKYAGGSIVATCKQLRAQYLPAYFALNTFQINRGTRLLAWIEAVGAENFKHIKRYRVVTTGSTSRWHRVPKHDITIDISLERSSETGKNDIRLDYSAPVGNFGNRWGYKCPVATFQDSLSDREDFGHVELLRTARFFCYKNSLTMINENGDQKTWYFVAGDGGGRQPEESLDEFVKEHVVRQQEREKANKKAKARRW